MTFHVHIAENNEISVPPDILCKAQVGHYFIGKFIISRVICSYNPICFHIYKLLDLSITVKYFKKYTEQDQKISCPRR